MPNAANPVLHASHQEYSQIYHNSLQKETIPSNDKSVTQNTKQKVYFKFFLLNNKKSLPTPIVWGARDVSVLDRDIDTFINAPITMHHDGDHPSPENANIFEAKYDSPHSFISAAMDYYSRFKVGRIVDVYKPDRSLYQAALLNPDVTVTYEGLGETEDPYFIRLLEQKERDREPLYVSPGVYALDDTKTGDNERLLNKFVGTHLAIVNQPAFTKPIAYVKKQTCNVDNKTCFFKLLTASEMVNLNNNEQPSNSSSINMVDNNNNSNNNSNPSQPVTPVQAPVAGVFDDTNEKVDTTVKDANGNILQKISTETQPPSPSPSQSSQEQEQQKPQPQDDRPKVEETIAKKETHKKEARKDDSEKMSFTRSEFDNIISELESKIIQAVESKQMEKMEQSSRLSLVNTFIPSTNEDLRPDYEFYRSLPLSSQQLKKVLEDSKFNPQNNSTGQKPKQNYVASTSQSKTVSRYSDDSTAASGTASMASEIHFLHDGEFIPARYR